MEPLTADLEPDEPGFPQRMIGLLERLLQSDFIRDEKSRDDVEIMVDMLKQIAAKS